jgi:hypothetical protein
VELFKLLSNEGMQREEMEKEMKILMDELSCE